MCNCEECRCVKNIASIHEEIIKEESKIVQSEIYIEFLSDIRDSMTKKYLESIKR